MADKSNWPAMMDVVTILKAEGDYECMIGGYPLEKPITEVRVRHTNKEVAQSRARQICALPAMVALLKEADEYRMNTEWFAQVRAVLKSIGEAPNA